jgi:hypothetical protein
MFALDRREKGGWNKFVMKNLSLEKGMQRMKNSKVTQARFEAAERKQQRAILVETPSTDRATQAKGGC